MNQDLISLSVEDDETIAVVGPGTWLGITTSTPRGVHSTVTLGKSEGRTFTLHFRDRASLERYHLAIDALLKANPASGTVHRGTRRVGDVPSIHPE